MDEVVGTLRAEALLLSGEASEKVDAAADTLMQVNESLKTRLRDTTAKVGVDSSMQLPSPNGIVICKC